ncbi:hypothetical protein AOLI_G00088600 [Acnodon oligacanthus]
MIMGRKLKMTKQELSSQTTTTKPGTTVNTSSVLFIQWPHKPVQCSGLGCTCGYKALGLYLTELIREEGSNLPRMTCQQDHPYGGSLHPLQPRVPVSGSPLTRFAHPEEPKSFDSLNHEAIHQLCPKHQRSGGTINTPSSSASPQREREKKKRTLAWAPGARMLLGKATVVVRKTQAFTT